jgi:cytochrome b pre-mRNA-processing protein 3
MLAWLRNRGNLRRTARSLYGSIVTQARRPGVYAQWGVPDTPEGRFEMIALHLVLALRRLSSEGEPGRALGQALTETFVVDLDDTLREMTVGDLAVPRHVKRAVAVVHERYASYGAALDGRQAEGLLNTAVEARLAGLRGAEGLDAARICAYIRGAARALDLQTGAQILSGHLAWSQVHAGTNDGTTAG